MNTTSDMLSSLACIYPICKRLLLHTAWPDRHLTGTQRLTLLTLAIHRSMTMTLLAEAMACSKEQATRAVAPLVEQGYLQRVYDDLNRTRVWVELTDQGRALFRDVVAVARQELHEMLGELSQEDQEKLRDALDVVRSLLEKVQPGLTERTQ